MRNMFAIVTCVCLMATGALAAMVDNPAYQNWAKYKPGTSIAYSQKTTSEQLPAPMQMEMKQTLKEITPEKAIIEMTISTAMMGEQRQNLDVPAKVEEANVTTAGKLPPGMKGEAKSLGKEKVKVGDKEYECEVTQIKGEQEGMTSEGKTWTTEELPGGLVKMEMKANIPGGQMTTSMELKDVQIKQ